MVPWAAISRNLDVAEVGHFQHACIRDQDVGGNGRSRWITPCRWAWVHGKADLEGVVEGHIGVESAALRDDVVQGVPLDITPSR